MFNCLAQCRKSYQRSTKSRQWATGTAHCPEKGSRNLIACRELPTKKVKLFTLHAAACAMLLPTMALSQDEVKLVIESWRADDLVIWEDTILPTFEAENPGIDVEFRPTPNMDYSTALATKLQTGTAGDLIMVESFDFRLQMYLDGDLANLADLDGIENFSDTAKSAWSTDDRTEFFGVPLAAVLHGFIYNADIFDELGLSEPTTIAEMNELLAAVKEDGRYTPMAMGTAQSFVPGLLGFQLIGPNYWKGEDGRNAVIEGSLTFDDPSFVGIWEELAGWGPFLPEGYPAISYPDMQNLFMLGTSAVYPAGSWEIPIFNAAVGDTFGMGAFIAPAASAGGECHFNDHMDMGIGMNANARHPEEAKKFLTWLTTEDFAKLWAEAMPGFFPLSTHAVQIDDPLANTFAKWRDQCRSTPRISYQIISRGKPNLDAEINRVTALVMNGEMDPIEAAKVVQDGLASWYGPQQGN